jgi:hypothetical protein
MAPIGGPSLSAANAFQKQRARSVEFLRDFLERSAGI